MGSAPLSCCHRGKYGCAKTKITPEGWTTHKKHAGLDGAPLAGGGGVLPPRHHRRDCAVEAGGGPGLTEPASALSPRQNLGQQLAIRLFRIKFLPIPGPSNVAGGRPLPFSVFLYETCSVFSMQVNTLSQTLKCKPQKRSVAFWLGAVVFPHGKICQMW